VKDRQSVYGMHAVRGLLVRQPERVQVLYLATSRGDARIHELETLARRHGCRIERLEPRAFTQLVGEVAHQGVAAEIVPLPAWTEDDLLGALEHARAPILLALDGVQDPHNLGACLRTADACGALAVIVPRDRAAQLTPAVRKVAAGAADTTPVVAVTNLARTLKTLKEASVWLVGADAEAPKPAWRIDLTGGIALVLGAEGSGLRQLTRQTCDFLVRLPQLGAVESLNVSVAAGMLLYEVVRQRAPAA
jgi:23S rRNA (guanosine2251-2'-O)-methyltransferase